MQQIVLPDYVNERPRHGQKHSEDTNQRDRRIIQLLVFGFGILCVIQALLNISLRLALNFSKESSRADCNTTGFDDQCGELKEVKLALTHDRDKLEKRNTELNNKIKELEEERERLKMQLRGQNCVSSQTCPPDWREINSRCYLLSSEINTWEESRKYCQSRGADLVVINSEQEQRALYRLNEEAVLLFWIGLSDTDGTYKWVDGSPLTTSFWESGQPNDGDPGNREDCVEMYHLRPELANWNDANCGKRQRCLCEKDQCTS